MSFIFQSLVLIADIAPRTYWRSNEIPSDWSIVAAGFAIAAAVVTAGLMVARLKTRSNELGQSRFSISTLVSVSTVVLGLVVVTFATLGTVWRAHWERARWMRKGASDAYKHQLWMERHQSKIMELRPVQDATEEKEKKPPLAADR